MSIKKPAGNPLKGIATIGIVDPDNTRMGPVAQVIMNRLAVESKNATVRSMKFYTAGYNRTSHNVADSAKGYLQMNGFQATAFMQPERVDKDWLITKDLIICTDRFIKRDLLHDFFPASYNDWKDKMVVFTDLVGSKEVLRDPGDDPTAPTKPVYDLIKQCCELLIKRLEKENP
jgi:protein-tyrosine-phosphatase